MSSPSIDLQDARLTFQQRRIVDALADAFPRRMHIKNIIEAVYFDDPQGGPDNAHNTVKVQIFNARKRLVREAWNISRRGVEPLGYYRLIANDNEQQERSAA